MSALYYLAALAQWCIGFYLIYFSGKTVTELMGGAICVLALPYLVKSLSLLTQPTEEES